MSLGMGLARGLPSGRVMMDEALDWLVAISEDFVLVVRQVRSLRLYRAESVVAGYDQDHVSSIERILCGKNQPFPFRGMHHTVDLEGSPCVIQSQFFGPAGQRYVGLGTAHKDDIMMTKQVVRDFEVLVDRDLAFVVIKEVALHLLGRVSIRTRLTHGAVNDHGRGEFLPDVAGKIGRSIRWFDDFELGARLIEE